MASEDCTVSSLTSELDNLTELHQLSGLLTTHHSRRTEDGFLIRGDRLPNCVPLPASKKGSRSWIWDHGHLIGVIKNNSKVLRHWLCKSCYDSNVHHPLPRMLLNTEKNTNPAINHLVRFHSYDRAGTKISLQMSKKRKQGSLESWNSQAIAHQTVFDNDGWKATYCR
jgi:hypothetical protein